MLRTTLQNESIGATIKDCPYISLYIDCRGNPLWLPPLSQAPLCSPFHQTSSWYGELSALLHCDIKEAMCVTSVSKALVIVSSIVAHQRIEVAHQIEEVGNKRTLPAPYKKI